MRWILFVFLFSISILRAQDREYIEIYNLIGQADTLNKNGEKQAAAEHYQKAQNALEKFQGVYPKWNENVVKFRLNYIAEKLQLIGPVGVVASEKTNLPPVNLPGEKTISGPELKEATKSSANKSSEVVSLEQKLIEVQKKRDLLNVALEQQKGSSGQRAQTAKQKGQTSKADLKKLRQLDQDEIELKKRLATARKNNSEAPSTKDLNQSKTTDQVQRIENPSESLRDSNSTRTNEEQLAESKPVKKTKQLPAGAGALVAQAERAFAAHRFDEAEKKYLEVLHQDEKNVYILGNLAATQLQMDHASDAEKNIGLALAIDPEDSFSLTLLGIIRFNQGKFDDALDVLNRSAKIDPQNPETQNYLGITLDQKGQRVPAEAALRRAINIQPNYAGAHNNLAVIYASEQPPFPQLARWHYEKALSLGHPKNPELEKMMAGEK